MDGDPSPPSPQPPQDACAPSTSRGGIADDTAASAPRKGILKRPSDIRKERDTIFPLYRQSPDRFPDKGATKIPKLNVSWFEKNTVAIFGDTSDENNTDSEQPGNRMYMTPITTNRSSADSPLSLLDYPNAPETAILTDEDCSLSHSPRRSRSEERACDVDDALSVTSSTGSAASYVVGRWWIAKDTRFVPHCQKRGCNHNHDDLGEYLTPTQRKNKEMNDLKKELRKALQERDEKEKHLLELRERIEEIEKVTEDSTVMNENHKLMQGKRELEKAFDAERKATEKKHAVRVNQLIQETMAAREEIARLTHRLSQLEFQEEERAAKTYADADTITDVIDPLYAGIYHAPSITMSPTGEMQLAPSPLLSPLSSPAHPFDPATMQQYVSRETANQLQAYRNEAIVWRSKASQLELVVRDHLQKTNEQENNLSVELETMRRECERLREMLRERESEGMADSGIENPTNSPQERRRIQQLQQLQQELEVPPPPPGPPSFSLGTSGDCLSSACADRKRGLINENKRLVDTIDDLNLRLAQSEESLAEFRDQLQDMERARGLLQADIAQTAKDMEIKQAEAAAANLVINRIQGEKDTLSKAVTYLEERLQVYQNTMMEHDLVVQDENPSEWRKGFNDPRYKVCVSKRCQTLLTAEALTEHEDEFQSIRKKLQALDEEFSEKRADLHDKFGEIEANLLTKTQLTETLSKQLAEAQKEAKHSMEEHQRERDEHETAMNRMMTIAEKVPVLESRVEQLHREKAELEVKMAGTKEEFEKALEDALQEALKKYGQQSKYWKEKLATIEKQLASSKSETQQVLRERDDQRMKWKVERAELEQRLMSSIGHVEELHVRIHRPTRDAECDARPKHVSKYVACRPHTKTRATEIEKGDLLDENSSEEKIKVLQSELTLHKRQMHVLQQKLIDSLNEKHEQRFKVRSRVSSADSLAPSGDEKRSKESAISSARVKSEEGIDERSSKHSEAINDLKEEIGSLRRKLQTSEAEKLALARGEKDRIQTIVTEFDSLRGELDEEMQRYVAERKWLRQRIGNLEESNEELQKTVEGLRALNQESSENRVKNRGEERIRKTFSEPRLAPDARNADEEVQKLLREKNVLNKELMRVRSLLERSAVLASTQLNMPYSSTTTTSFADLVSDLNTARADLERVLVTLDRDDEALDTAEILESRSALSATAPRTAKKDSPETILDMVMTDWKNDEVENLAKELRRSRQERESLRLRVDRLSKQMREATAELEIYRREGRCLSPEGLPLKRQSRSTIDLTREAVDLSECIRWKEKTGTMFRELTRMRTGFQEVQAERRELRVQLAIMRGELELARCQVSELTLGEERRHKAKSEQPSGPRLRSSSARNRDATRDDDHVHRPSRKEDSSRERPPKDPFMERAPSEDSRRVERVSTWVREPQPASRTRSEERRRRSKSRGRTTSKTSKGDSIKDSSPFSFVTAAESLGSMPSLSCGRPTSSLMSHSWHTAVINSEESETSMRRQSRMISLREKVTRMNKENKELKERLHSIEKARTPLQQSGTIEKELIEERDKLLRENERMKKEMRERKKSDQPALNMVVDKKEVDELRQENAVMKKEILDMKKKKSDSSPSVRSREITRLKDETVKLKEEIAQLKEKLGRAQMKRSDSFATASLSIPAAAMTQSAHAALSRSRSASGHSRLSQTTPSQAPPTKAPPSSLVPPPLPPHRTFRLDQSMTRSAANSRPCSAPDPDWSPSPSPMDVDERLTEVLKEENRRLKKALEKMTRDSSGEPRVSSLAKEERDKMRASNERLRSAIEQLKSEQQSVDTARIVQEREELQETNKRMKEEVGKLEKERTSLVAAQKDLSDRLRMSQTQTELYERKLREMEDERKEMYLVMFKKGQQAAAMGVKEDQVVDSMTEDRIVLKFLHDAFYYFLLNKGDSKEHLQAMMTMLNFTSEQREDVAKKRGVQ